MSARVLLAELESAGIVLTRADRDIRYMTRPGVSIACYREVILANKRALLYELLKREVMAAATVEPEEFDRPAYLLLTARLYEAEADVVEQDQHSANGRASHLAL